LQVIRELFVFKKYCVFFIYRKRAAEPRPVGPMGKAAKQDLSSWAKRGISLELFID